MRPKPAAEAYLRLKTLPGEQAQVDWVHFGTVRISRAERPLMGFVMVLSYSHLIFLRFYASVNIRPAVGHLHPCHAARRGEESLAVRGRRSGVRGRAPGCRSRPDTMETAT